MRPALLWDRTEGILFRHVLKTRAAAFFLLGLLLPNQFGAEDRPFALAIAVWLLIACWTVATAWRADAIFRRLKHQPAWILVEQLLVISLLFVGGWRSLAYLFALSPIVLATLFLNLRLGIYVATIDAVTLAGFLGIAPQFGLEPLFQPARVTEWLVAILAYYLAVFFCNEVRLRYIELAGRFERQVWRATQHELAHSLHNKVRQIFPAIKLRLIGLREDYGADPRLRDEIQWLAERADEGITYLDEMVGEIAGSRERTVAKVARVAAARVESIGGVTIELVLDGSDGATLDRRRANVLQRFLEEALTNAWKHGMPPVRLKADVTDDREIHIEVTNLGSHLPMRRRGLGLQALRRDATQLAGAFSIASESGITSVSLTFPT